MLLVLPGLALGLADGRPNRVALAASIRARVSRKSSTSPRNASSCPRGWPNSSARSPGQRQSISEHTGLLVVPADGNRKSSDPDQVPR